MTINAARQDSEEDLEESIRAGKLADPTILSGKPLTMDPGRLLESRIVETVPHGRSIYRAPSK